MGFYFLSISIYPMPPASIASVTGAFFFSWVIGFVAVFAPGGLGVREGLMWAMLSGIMPQHIALVIAFAGRIWWTASEAVVFLISFATQKRSTRQGKQT
ncbi:MAG TPA: hypothetical protein HA362_04610 [Nanoarchaeota archaeon]|nr:hypothetical protein [Nanoarchaeota archaeon]